MLNIEEINLVVINSDVVPCMMTEIVSIGYGILAMASWGCGDFLAKRIIGFVGYYRLALYVQLVGLAPTLVLAAMFAVPVPTSPRTIALILATGISSTSAMFFFYKALSLGKASLVTPVAYASPIVAVVFSFGFLGETLNLLQIMCVILVIVGILMVSMRTDIKKLSSEGVPYAVICMLSAGIGSILVKLVSMDIGGIGTLFYSRMFVTCILLMTLPFLGEVSYRYGSPKIPLKTIIIVGITEFVGLFGLIVGLSVGIVSIIAPIASASPVVTVALGQILLNEKLVRIHKMAVVLVIVGILFLSALAVL